MATVPLNLFRSLVTPLSTIGLVPSLYTAPSQRASILLTAQTTNITDSYQTVTASISSATYSSLTFLVSGFAITPYDAANIILGKIVLTEGDKLIVYCSQNDSVHLTLSILETINTPA